MAFPEDYFLPAKSFLDDAPPGAELRFFEILKQQFEGVRLMLNERRAAVALAPIAAFPSHVSRRAEPNGTATTLNKMRTDVMATAVKFVNTNLAPGGSIEGLAAIPLWNFNTILAAAGINGGASWTRVPARNSFGKPASTGSTLHTGDVCYKEHINELIQVIDQMDVAVVQAGMWASERRFGTGLSLGGVTCANQKLNAEASWDADSWNSLTNPSPALSAGTCFAQSEQGPLLTGAGLSNRRAKVQADLSGIPAGTARCFIKLRVPGGTGTNNYGQIRPTTAAVNTYGEWAAAAMVVGSVQTTGYVTGSDLRPAWVAQQNCINTWREGWFNVDQVVVITGVPWVYALP